MTRRIRHGALRLETKSGEGNRPSLPTLARLLTEVRSGEAEAWPTWAQLAWAGVGGAGDGLGGVGESGRKKERRGSIVATDQTRECYGMGVTWR